MPIMVIPFLTNCKGAKTFTVTWKNYDGTVLETDLNVVEGSIPSYDQKEDPTKPPSKEVVYHFSGWDGDITKGITADTTFTAQFSESTRTYKITFVNYDDMVLDEQEIEFGQTPIYQGEHPSKPATEEYYYAFKGWDKKITPAVIDTTYKATFDDVLLANLAVYMTIEIPLGGATFSFDYEATNDVEVYWGDRETSETNVKEHTYSESGEYHIKVYGDCTSASAVHNDYLEEIYFGKSITSIPKNSFSYSRVLHYVYISEGTTIINDGAFYSCSLLTQVDFSDTITRIGEFAFARCASLLSINIPASVTGIDYCAFASCSSLESISVDPNNECYDSRNDCNAIITSKDITVDEFEFKEDTLILGCSKTIIPSDVVEIWWYAFQDSYITSIVIPRSVASIGFNAFTACYFLESVTLNEGLTIIEEQAFANCFSLTSIVIPNTVVSIGGSAFYNCIYLENITLNEGLNEIGDEAFAGCGFSYIKIPSTVTSFGEYTFDSCYWLTTVDLTAFADETKIPECGNNSFVNCPVDLKFKVTSEEMAKAFIAKGNGWPTDINKYSW